MKFKLKSLLKDKNVLYIVFFLAVMNLFGYLIVGNIDAVTFFLIIGFLSSYFSKNMIVIMIISILLTSVFVSSHYLGNNKLTEGFKSDNTNKKNKEGIDKNIPVPVDEEQEEAEVSGKPTVDYASTLESAYDNIDKLLSSDALNSMSNETQRLADKQEKLMGNIKKLEPMMQRAGGILEGLDMDGMKKMISGVESKLSKIQKGEKN
jgi:hypothetical protein